MVSDDTFFLAQLDHSFDTSYAHLSSAMQGYLRGWHHNCQKPVVVDKNRAWLHAIETLLAIEPDARLIVCLRDLGQIYGSIEAQHQRTILIDFIDHLADYDRFGRADVLFAKDKAIGAPLISLRAVPDLPRHVQERLFFVRFEDLMKQPAACMALVYQWLGVCALTIDVEQLEVREQESDSHYHMKYTHRQASRITAPKRHDVPPRIQALIESACAWYYQLYYPQVPSPPTGP
jgi:sulfotransferase